MSVTSELSDRLKDNINRVTTIVRQQLLGQNNERLDFLMDSFYKLSPEQRNGAVAGAILVLVLFVGGAVSLYFSRVGALEDELSSTYQALQTLRNTVVQDQIEDKKFTKLVSVIKRKTSGLNFKPFFEKRSRESNVEIRSINEQVLDIDPNDKLSDHFRQVNVELRIPKISIPRLMNFLIDIEKSGKYLRVQDLKVTGLYGNKLFFESTVIIRGYTPKS